MAIDRRKVCGLQAWKRRQIDQFSTWLRGGTVYLALLDDREWGEDEILNRDLDV